MSAGFCCSESDIDGMVEAGVEPTEYSSPDGVNLSAVIVDIVASRSMVEG